MGSESTTTPTKAAMAIVYVTLNCIIINSGVRTMHALSQLKQDGWGDTTSSFARVFQILPIAISGYLYVVVGVLGCVGGSLYWKLGALYDALYYLVVGVFATFIIPVTTLFYRASYWKRKAYPAEPVEVSVRADFDNIYCHAHANYLCNEVPMTEATAIFFPDQANSSILASYADLNGMNSICRALQSSVPSLSTVCDSCAATTVKDSMTYRRVLDWSNDKCPRSDSTMRWCGNYLVTGNDTSVTTGVAPYTTCRVQFLEMMDHTWTTVFVAWLIVIVASFIVASIRPALNALCSRRQRRAPVNRRRVYA